MTATTIPATRGGGYVDADGTPRPFPLRYCLLLVGLATFCFPVLLTGWVDIAFFRRARVQRGAVILSVGLLQLTRAALALLIWRAAWTWLAWILVPLLVLRIWRTAHVWWDVIEQRETAS